MRELWGTIAHTSGAKVYSLLVGLLSLFITARLLGPEGRGQVATINTWVLLFGTLGGLSLGQVALHRMAADASKARFGILLNSLVVLAIALTAISWVIAFGMYHFNPNGAFKGLATGALLIGFLSVPFIIWESYGSSLLIGLDRLRTYNRYQIFGRSMSVLAIVVLVWQLNLGVSGAIWAGLLGQVVVAMGGIGSIRAYVSDKRLERRVDTKEIAALLEGGVKLHLNTVGVFLYSSASVLVLNHFHGAEQAGYLQLATQLFNMLVIVPQAASMAMFGTVTNLGPDRAWPQNLRLLAQVSAGMFLLGGLAWLLAPALLTLMIGEEFRPAVDLFQLMLLGLIGITFSTVMAPQWIGRGYFTQTAILTLVVGATNFGANLLLVPKHGARGAVFAFLSTYAVSIVVNGLMAWHCQTEFKRCCRVEASNVDG